MKLSRTQLRSLIKEVISDIDDESHGLGWDELIDVLRESAARLTLLADEMETEFGEDERDEVFAMAERAESTAQKLLTAIADTVRPAGSEG